MYTRIIGLLVPANDLVRYFTVFALTRKVLLRLW